MRLLISLLFLCSTLSGVILDEEQTVRWVLKEGGMEKALISRAQIEFVTESLGVVYRLTIDGRVFYVKFVGREGARGSFFLKHLIPADFDIERIFHRSERLRWGRYLLQAVHDEARETLVPLPLSFDLKAANIDSEGIFEVFIPSEKEEKEFPRKLQGLIATLWEGIELEPFPLVEDFDDASGIYDPTNYAPKTLKEMLKGYGEFQQEANRHLSESLLASGLLQDDDSSYLWKLVHEERLIQPLKASIHDKFLSTFGFSEETPLHELAKALINPSSRERKKLSLTIKKSEAVLLFSLESMRDCLGLSPLNEDEIALSLEELEKAFLSQVNPSQVDPPSRNILEAKAVAARLPFHYIAFCAERDLLWGENEILFSKMLVQCKECYGLLKWLKNKPEELARLIEQLATLEPLFQKLEELPLGVVLYDAHPANILINKKDGKAALLDFEDLSIGLEIADLANVYFYKLLRAGVSGVKTKEELLPLIEAIVEGYEEGREETLSKETIALFPVYNAALFLNHLKQFRGILIPDFSEVDEVNQAFSWPVFLEQWDAALKAIDYLDELL